MISDVGIQLNSKHMEYSIYVIVCNHKVDWILYFNIGDSREFLLILSEIVDAWQFWLIKYGDRRRIIQSELVPWIC